MISYNLQGSSTKSDGPKKTLKSLWDMMGLNKTTKYLTLQKAIETLQSRLAVRIDPQRTQRGWG